MIPVDMLVVGAMEVVQATLAAVARRVEPTVVGFRPLPTAARHPPWESEVVIVDDLGVAPAQRERSVR